MLRQSSFVSETSSARADREEKYYIAFSIALFVCGALLLLTPLIDRNGAFILAAGWMLLLVLSLDILRPLFFSRGVADVVMAIITAAYYAFLGFAVGTDVLSIENYRLGLCLAVFFAGISRILAYARMIVVVNLPLMPVCGFAEMAVAVMLFMGWPGEGAGMIYWLIGMTVVLTGFESLREAASLRVQSL